MKNKFILIIVLFIIGCGDFCDDDCRFNKMKEPVTVIICDKKIGKILLRDATGLKTTFSNKTTLGDLLINNLKKGDTVCYGSKYIK